MLAAPPSWAAATNRAPAATSALVTWKLPLPTTPKTWSTPCAASARPDHLGDVHRAVSARQRQHPARAAGAVHDRQRPGDDDRAGRRQRGQVLQLGQAELAVPEQERVARERRVERVRQRRRRCRPSPRRRPGSAPPRPATGRTRRRCPGCGPRWRTRPRRPTGRPSRCGEQPAAGRQRPVLGLPRLDVLDLEQEVRVRGGLRPTTSSTTAGRDQLPGRHLRHVGRRRGR